MKSMKCHQLGGPATCQEEFKAETFDEIADMSKAHGMDMFQKNDEPHLEAMQKMRERMQKPEDMHKWMDEKREEFENMV